MWKVLSMLSTLIFCGIQCPRNGCFLWRVQCDTHVWLNQNASRKDAFHDRWSQCIIFFTGKCPQNRCLLWQWFSMCHCKMPPTWTSLMTQVVNVKPCKTLFWLGQSPPILAAFRTDVLNVTLCVVKRNAPETDAFYDKCSQCEALLCCTECFQILEQTFFTVKDILADNIRMRSDCLFC